MAAITASMVKELRETTGAGMMDCKKALAEADGDMTRAVEIIRENFDLRPAGIIRMLDLRRPIYKQTAAYGHFGRTDLDLPWEKLDRVDALKAYL